jgi:HEAT repeat protein
MSFDLASYSHAFDRAARAPGIGKSTAPLSSTLLFGAWDLGAEGTGFLAGRLAARDPRQRLLAAQLLGQLNRVQGIAPLARASGDGDFQVSVTAALALALTDLPEAIPALRELAAAPKNRGVEVNAIFGLCRLRAPGAVPLAVAFLENSANSVEVRSALASSLAVLADAHVMPVIDRALELFPRSTAFQSAAADFYEALGTPEALDRLLNLSRCRPGAGRTSTGSDAAAFTRSFRA